MENTPKLFSFKNASVTSGPKERPTPRLLGPLPGRGCGSLQRTSHISPTHTNHRVYKTTILRVKKPERFQSVKCTK